TVCPALPVNSFSAATLRTWAASAASSPAGGRTAPSVKNRAMHPSAVVAGGLPWSSMRRGALIVGPHGTWGLARGIGLVVELGRQGKGDLLGDHFALHHPGGVIPRQAGH